MKKEFEKQLKEALQFDINLEKSRSSPIKIQIPNIFNFLKKKLLSFSFKKFFRKSKSLNTDSTDSLIKSIISESKGSETAKFIDLRDILDEYDN